jgi:beta-glucosidase
MSRVHHFPKGFLWGVSTASYQIEGAAHEDGKGESIWDAYTHTPGKVINNENGDVAADHYHLWRQDIALMKDLGYRTYRFSIAWPRILPAGTGKMNEPGLVFYDHLVDGLLEAGITPVVTLYHWDLPVALSGGWLNRATADAFVEYTDVVTRRLGDRVKMWTTLNEPFCASFSSYAFGYHAPGEKNLAHALQAGHHLLLAHGLAVPVIRANVPLARVSIVVNPAPTIPASSSVLDREACRFQDGLTNRWLLDPLFGRDYPQDMRADFTRMGVWQDLPAYIKPGDMQVISVPLDLLGVNYYSRHIVAGDPDHPDQPELSHGVMPPDAQKTDFGWEVYPQGFYDLLAWLKQTYSPKSMFIAENGVSYGDGPDASGAVHDLRRMDFLRSHLVTLAHAIADGIPVEGYFHWSFLDNFEWAAGFSQRFGLIYTDYATRKRYPKDSAYLYQQIIAANSVSE